jgi:predicted O-methyltransferase YrrM
MISTGYVSDYIRKTIGKNKGILAELESYAEKNGIPILNPETGRFISVLGHIKKPGRILEAGTAIGYSAILFSSFLKHGGRLDTIESNEEMYKKAVLNIKKAGLDRIIHIIPGDAADVLKHLDKKYDMIFIDIAKGQYVELFPECLRILKKDGILLSDNVLYRGMVANDRLVPKSDRTIVNRMREYLEILCGSDELETAIVPVGDGVSVSYRK